MQGAPERSTVVHERSPRSGHRWLMGLLRLQERAAGRAEKLLIAKWFEPSKLPRAIAWRRLVQHAEKPCARRSCSKASTTESTKTRVLAGSSRPVEVERNGPAVRIPARQQPQQRAAFQVRQRMRHGHQRHAQAQAQQRGTAERVGVATLEPFAVDADPVHRSDRVPERIPNHFAAQTLKWPGHGAWNAIRNQCSR